MATSSLERHDLEQDIEELRDSISSLESSRSRLRDIVPAEGAPQSGSVWTDLTAIVTDFFEAAGEAISDASEDDDDDDDGGSAVAGKAVKTVKAVVSTDWSKELGEAFGRLRDRLSGDAGSSSSPPVAELGGVLGELDSELARLTADLQRKLDRVAELDHAVDDVDTIVPADDVVVVQDDDDIDVVPIPVDVLPDVDPDPAVITDDDTDTDEDDDDDIDDIVPVPTPDVDPVVDVIPVDPLVTPADDDTTDDDTPAYDSDKQTDIGELDGAVYDINDILAGGRTVADLRRYDVPAGVVRDAGISASAMLDGGYTLAELHEAGIQSGDLHGLAGATDLRSAGYTAADLHGIFSVSECVEAFSPHELRDAGFAVSDFHGLVPAADLRDVFSISELHTVYSVSELRSAGFDAADLNAGGIGWADLAAAGFALADLQDAGASESTLRELFPAEFTDDDEDGQ
jgi:hypothetical protein